ncbi:MAG: glycosyltransferase family 39 protein [Candidatus Woesearchaeota archaeon]
MAKKRGNKRKDNRRGGGSSGGSGNSGEAEISMDAILRNWNWILLGLILIFGFCLRAYHADYPVIGYHNWKEMHYLSEARNYAEDGFFANGFLAPEKQTHNLDTMNHGLHADTFPAMSIAAGLAFRIFGIDVGVARWTSILFMMGSIILLYLVVKKLFRREDLAITAALIASANPLFVFFGRQVQMINPALFFGLLSILLYLMWLESGDAEESSKLLVLASLSFMISFLTKYSFALLAIPMLAIFPWKKVLSNGYLRKNWKQYAYAASSVLLLPLWLLNNKLINDKLGGGGEAGGSILGDIQMDLSIIFTSDFWGIMKSYAADNYSLIGVLFAFAGLVLFMSVYTKKRDEGGFRRGEVFLIAYMIGSIPWFWVMGDKLANHNYHQYPLAPLAIILMAFCFVVAGATIGNAARIKGLKWACIAAFFLLLIYPPVLNSMGGIFDAKDRMFDTQFIGLDVAGDYVREHSSESEKIFHSGFQSRGFLWHAHRKGWTLPENTSLIKIGEENHDYKWIFLYKWGLSNLENPSIKEYLESNYRMAQIGLVRSGSEEGLAPIYILLERGGSFSLENLSTSVARSQPRRKDYEFTDGARTLHYMNI